MVRIVLGMGLACGLTFGFSGVASAQALTGEQAAAALFAPTGAEVELLKTDFLPKDQAELLRQVGAAQPYYGAIAVSPDEGIMVDATVAAANQHSVEAASVAARAACDAKRKGARPCEVVALIRPAGLGAARVAAFLGGDGGVPGRVREGDTRQGVCDLAHDRGLGDRQGARCRCQGGKGLRDQRSQARRLRAGGAGLRPARWGKLPSGCRRGLINIKVRDRDTDQGARTDRPGMPGLRAEPWRRT